MLDIKSHHFASSSDSQTIPLVVDLDGTLTRADTLVESVLKIIRVRPISIFLVLFWLLGGRSRLKSRVAAVCIPDASLLPYRESVLRTVRAARAEGRQTILATAADQRIGEAVAAHLGIFDEVVSSSSVSNLRHQAKADLLVSRFGVRGYDYIGNCLADVPAWLNARWAIAAGGLRPTPEVMLIRLDDDDNYRWVSLLRALRPQQWVKNALLFAPLLASQAIDLSAIARVAAAATCFCLIASAIYIINDLLDLESDRKHDAKKFRPFASGMARAADGVALASVLLVAGIGGALLLSTAFAWTVLAYIALNFIYSLKLKQLPLADVMVLAALYTIRVIAGAATLAIWPSFWLLAFSLFLFTSLAFVKRFVEIKRYLGPNVPTIAGRGYRSDDAHLLCSFGVSSGYGAVIMLALYVNYVGGQDLYLTPALLWLVCPLLFYWISHVWMSAHQPAFHDDPVVFAIRDRVSWLLAAASGILVLVADRIRIDL